MARTLDLAPWAGRWVAVDAQSRVRSDAASLAELLAAIEHEDLGEVEVMRAPARTIRWSTGLADRWISAFIDTNILVRHLTGDPPEMAARSTRFLADADQLYLADLIVAETVYVLGSFCSAPRHEIATAMRSLLSMRSVVTVDAALLLRSIEVFEVDRLDFAEAHLVACAESTAVGRVASIDRAIDRVATIERLGP